MTKSIYTIEYDNWDKTATVQLEVSGKKKVLRLERAVINMESETTESESEPDDFGYRRVVRTPTGRKSITISGDAL